MVTRGEVGEDIGINEYLYHDEKRLKNLFTIIMAGINLGPFSP